MFLKVVLSMLSINQVSIGEGRFKLEATITKTQDGINIYLGGGEKTHIGTVVLCQPRESLKQDGSRSVTTSILNIVGHKDDDIAKPIAEKLCLNLNERIVISAGVHIEKATEAEIQKLLEMGKRLTEKIIESIEREGNDNA
jgi:hypothetical protein